jgi:surface antigen
MPATSSSSSIRNGPHALLLGTALLGAVVACTMPNARAQMPTFGADQGACDRSAMSEVFSTSSNNLMGSALGAAAGGLLGNQIGKGGGNTAATIIGVLGGALAGGAVGRSMAPPDQGCVSRALENAPTNQTVAWHNPDSDTSYWVTPTNTYQASDGSPCREYITHAVINGHRERVNGTACRQPDGSWKIQN